MSSQKQCVTFDSGDDAIGEITICFPLYLIKEDVEDVFKIPKELLNDEILSATTVKDLETLVAISRLSKNLSSNLQTQMGSYLTEAVKKVDVVEGVTIMA